MAAGDRTEHGTTQRIAESIECRLEGPYHRNHVGKLLVE